MSTPHAIRKPRIRYRCRIALFPSEWDVLEKWSALRAITGEELIGAILTSWIQGNPVPDMEWDASAPDEVDD